MEWLKLERAWLCNPWSEEEEDEWCPNNLHALGQIFYWWYLRSWQWQWFEKCCLEIFSSFFYMPDHTAAVVKVAVRYCKFSEMTIHPYIPDLAFNDYYLFSEPKFSLWGRKFVTMIYRLLFWMILQTTILNCLRGYRIIMNSMFKYILKPREIRKRLKFLFLLQPCPSN